MIWDKPTIIAGIIFILGGIGIIALGISANKVRASREAEYEQQMLKAGFERTFVPITYREIWVKKEEKSL